MKDINKKSRTVSEALDTRLTCRAFKSTAIKKEVIFNILNKARRSPSGGNLQPWKVFILSGEPLKKLIKDVNKELIKSYKMDSYLLFNKKLF